MLDSFLSAVLSFSHLNSIILIIFLGLLFVDRKIFFNLTLLLIFSIIVNVALKVTFKVPLPEFLHKDWFAFPSGHMQASTVVYLWIAKQLQNRIVNAVVYLLLTLIGYALVHFGFHNVIDIVAGFLVAVVLIYSAQKLVNHDLQNILNGLLIISTILVLYSFFRFPKPLPHSWSVYLLLLVIRVLYTCRAAVQRNAIAAQYFIASRLANRL